MKSVFDGMSLKDKQALVHLYETDGYTVLKKAMEVLRINAATHALTAVDFNEVKHLQGQAHGLKMLNLNLKELHKGMSKD